MELRTEKRIGALLIGCVVPAGLFAQTFQYEVKKGRDLGTLMISDTSVSFERKYREGKTPKKPEAFVWDYQDIQQLKIESKSLTVLTYQDNKWRFGADRQYEFKLVSEKTFEDAYSVLRRRLDQRLVAAIADTPHNVLWEIPVKHLRSFSGDEGVLQVESDQIIYKSLRSNQSRSWRYEDIDNISSSGPFQLTITSFERARMHYGSRRGFEFELKQRLEEARYNDLWLRLNRSKGLRVLTSY